MSYGSTGGYHRRTASSVLQSAYITVPRQFCRYRVSKGDDLCVGVVLSQFSERQTDIRFQHENITSFTAHFQVRLHTHAMAYSIIHSPKAIRYPV